MYPVWITAGHANPKTLAMNAIQDILFLLKQENAKRTVITPARAAVSRIVNKFALPANKDTQKMGQHVNPMSLVL